MGETLVHRHPPTPPITGAEYQAGLSHIVQYNTDGSYSFGEVSYGSPASVAHEGIPSHMSRVVSHTRVGQGLGIQYVRALTSFADQSLTNVQDGYGPAEYYHTGQHSGMQVNEVSPHILGDAAHRNRITKGRSRHQLQGQQRTMTPSAARLAVAEP